METSERERSGSRCANGCRVRSFAASDRAAIRHICCETGFMGRPVDALYSDREAFADFLTGYYTDHEPQHCLVAETAKGRVVGYIVAATRFRRYRLWKRWLVLRSIPSMLKKMAARRYSANDYAFLRWLVLHAGRQTPRTPKRAAHFHINILPEARGDAGRQLLAALLKAIPRWRVGCLYGQMQIYETRRREQLFKRFGFQLFDRCEVTKFERFGIKGVHVATFVRTFPQ